MLCDLALMMSRSSTAFLCLAHSGSHWNTIRWIVLQSFCYYCSLCPEVFSFKSLKSLLLHFIQISAQMFPSYIAFPDQLVWSSTSFQWLPAYPLLFYLQTHPILYYIYLFLVVYQYHIHQHIGFMKFKLTCSLVLLVPWTKTDTQSCFILLC